MSFYRAGVPKQPPKVLNNNAGMGALMPMFKRACVVLLVIGVSACGGNSTTQSSLTDKSKEEQGVRTALADFIEAWNRHDAKAFSMVFAEDADFANVDGLSAHGRAEVETFHAPRFATTFKDTHLKITETRIRSIKPDVAAVDARWEMTGARSRDGQDIPLRKGLLNFVMTKERGKWLITVMHNLSLPASP
jgi:uncharacterized protein (TIGR02246 family)